MFTNLTVFLIFPYQNIRKCKGAGGGRAPLYFLLFLMMFLYYPMRIREIRQIKKKKTKYLFYQFEPRVSRSCRSEVTAQTQNARQLTKGARQLTKGNTDFIRTPDGSSQPRGFKGG
jgi:hypothetical protein